MPVVEDQAPAPRPPRIEPSAAVELFWLLHQVSGEVAAPADDLRPGLDQARLERLRPRVLALWGDRSQDFSEVVILAQLGGHLTDTTLDGLLAHLGRAHPVHDEQLKLASETAQDRSRLLGRLHRLAAEPRLRQTYVKVLAETWELARPAWEAEGLATVLQACEDRRQVAPDASLRELLGQPAGHGSDFLVEAEAALERGQLLLVLTYLGHHWAYLDLPGLFLVAVPVRRSDPLSSLRRQVEAVARRVKVLADPTRLAILASLTRGPATISETAAAFGLAQPTVSAHFRLLREAGLVVLRKTGGRKTFEVDQDRVRGVLAEMSKTLLLD